MNAGSSRAGRDRKLEGEVADEDPNEGAGVHWLEEEDEVRWRRIFGGGNQWAWMGVLRGRIVYR